LTFAGFLMVNMVSAVAGTVNHSPGKFHQRQPAGGLPDQGTLDEIGRFFESLGPRYLKSQQVLTLDVLNVDLAGKIEWWRRDFYDTRILRDIYPPRFTLS